MKQKTEKVEMGKRNVKENKKLIVIQNRKRGKGIKKREKAILDKKRVKRNKKIKRNIRQKRGYKARDIMNIRREFRRKKE